MVQTEEILGILRRDYPNLRFRSGKKFTFRPPRTIIYEQNHDSARTSRTQSDGCSVMDSNSNPCQTQPDEQNALGDNSNACRTQAQDDECNTLDDNMYTNRYCMQILHEVGHALLGHRSYRTDPERLRMECAAWEKARELCGIYNIYYDEDFAEEQLDSYRNWLHQRSTCPECGLTCFQTRDGVYHCPSCDNRL